MNSRLLNSYWTQRTFFLKNKIRNGAYLSMKWCLFKHCCFISTRFVLIIPILCLHRFGQSPPLPFRSADAQKNPYRAGSTLLHLSHPAFSRLYRHASPLAGVDGKNPVFAGAHGTQRRCTPHPRRVDAPLWTHLLLRHLSIRRDAGYFCMVWLAQKKEQILP